MARFAGSDTKTVSVGGVEYDVEFDYKGYYAPAKTCGRPESCYPAEGEIEFEITSVDPPASEEIRHKIIEWLEENYEMQEVA